MKTRNKILIFTSIFLFIFIISMIVIFCIKGSIPDTLVNQVLGVGGIVDVMTAVIAIADKIVESKKIDEK